MAIGTVRGRIILGVFAVVCLVAGLCGFAFSQFHMIGKQAISLNEDSVPSLTVIGQIATSAVSVHATVRHHVAEPDPVRMRELAVQVQQQSTALDQEIASYSVLSITDRDKELYADIKAALAPYEQLRGRLIALSGDPKTKADARRLLEDQGEPAYDRLRGSIQVELDLNKASADQASRRIREAVDTAKMAVVYGSVLALSLTVLAGVILVRTVDRPLSELVAAVQPMSTGDFSRRLDMKSAKEFELLAGGFNLMADSLQEMIRRIQKSGLQINSSATEIAATAQEQLSTASEVAATTSEIGATSKEISATSKELAQTLKQIAQIAERTASLAVSGQNGLSRMKLTMQQVAEASAAIHAKLDTMSEKTGNIGAVIVTITRVADQTNLLSLNAAIEAEKAGDYGRGFAVVATEIRRLADQTAAATGDIEKTVQEMQSATAAGVMGMDKFSDEVRRGVDVVQQVSEELSQIIEHVQTLLPNFESVNEGMQSQALGAQQISDSLSQLTDASRQTVESLRQSNLAIDQLNGASRGLQDGVAKFTLRA